MLTCTVVSDLLLAEAESQHSTLFRMTIVSDDETGVLFNNSTIDVATIASSCKTARVGQITTSKLASEVTIGLIQTAPISGIDPCLV